MNDRYGKSSKIELFINNGAALSSAVKIPRLIPSQPRFRRR